MAVRPYTRSTVFAMAWDRTYRSNGRDMRLTDVYGTLIPQIANA